MRPERWRREAHCIADLRRMAKRVLPRPIFDFADGGAQDERTLRRNEQAFDGITLLPRPLNGAAERDLSLELFGRRISMPVIIGPTGLAGLFWPMGEQAAARAAASAGTAMTFIAQLFRLDDRDRIKERLRVAKSIIDHRALHPSNYDARVLGDAQVLPTLGLMAMPFTESNHQRRLVGSRNGYYHCRLGPRVHSVLKADTDKASGAAEIR